MADNLVSGKMSMIIFSYKKNLSIKCQMSLCHKLTTIFKVLIENAHSFFLVTQCFKIQGQKYVQCKF